MFCSHGWCFQNELWKNRKRKRKNKDVQIFWQVCSLIKEKNKCIIFKSFCASKTSYLVSSLILWFHRDVKWRATSDKQKKEKQQQNMKGKKTVDCRMERTAMLSRVQVFNTALQFIAIESVGGNLELSIRWNKVWVAPPCLLPKHPQMSPCCLSAAGRWQPTAPAALCRKNHDKSKSKYSHRMPPLTLRPKTVKGKEITKRRIKSYIFVI